MLLHVSSQSAFIHLSLSPLSVLAPISVLQTQSESNMRSILDLLFQICFRPRLSGDSLATEREAVLSELQVMDVVCCEESPLINFLRNVP